MSDSTSVPSSDVEAKTDERELDQEYSDEDEDDDVEYYNDYILDDWMDRHEDFDQDFEMLCELCPEADFKEVPALDELEVTFPLSTNFLEDHVAHAWKLQPRTPVFVKIQFSYAKYSEDFGSIKVEAYQEGAQSKQAKVYQLERMLTSFLKNAMEEHGDHLAVDDSASDSLHKEDPSPSQSKKARLEGAEEPLPPDPFVVQVDDMERSGKGLLAEVYLFCEDRLHTLNMYCIICSSLQTNANMLKPKACDLDLCAFTYIKFHQMGDTHESGRVEQEPAVIDLLIAMAKAASISSRWALIFDPFPTVADSTKPDQFIFTPKDKTSIDRIRIILSKFKGMSNMAKMGPELKAQLDVEDCLLFSLLQWIISSNLSYIVSLQSHQLLSCMKTPYQFLLRSASPKKEEIFMKAKEIHGSVYAFHGSSFENWHSIVRKGLVSASGTDLELNGAVYGKGVYVSPDAGMSFAFSSRNLKPHTQRQNEDSDDSLHTKAPQSISCMALCEVINAQCLQKATDDIWVMPEEDFVVTRFLFVFTNKDQKNSAVRTDDPKVLAHIQTALA